MRGLITTRDVFFEARTIVQEFGFKVWLRCLNKIVLQRKPCTFLECIA